MNDRLYIGKQYKYDCIVYLVFDKGYSQEWVVNVTAFLKMQDSILLVLCGEQKDFLKFKKQSVLNSITALELTGKPPDLHGILKAHLKLTSFLDLLVIRSEVFLAEFSIRELKKAFSQHQQIGTVSTLSNSSKLFHLYQSQKKRVSLTLTNNLLVNQNNSCSVYEVPFFYPNFVYWNYRAISTVLEADLKRPNPMNLAISANEAGFLHVVTPSLYIEDKSKSGKLISKKLDRHPLSLPIITRHPLTEIRLRIRKLIYNVQPETSSDPQVQTLLHVMHSWGGGLHQWVSNYVDTDKTGCNYVLKSIGDWGAFGKRLSLYNHPNDTQPIRYWELYHPIHGTVLSHLQYSEIVQTIIHDYGIDRILVSSLIGHSLDILKTGTKTTSIIHDFYPFCPAIYTYYGKICTACNDLQLDHCQSKNPLNYFFNGVPTSLWIKVREYYIDCIRQNTVDVITPSNSAEVHLKSIAPGLRQVDFHCIPHGLASPPTPDQAVVPNRVQRLKVLILGRLDTQKGLELYQNLSTKIIGFADLFFLGCGNEGREFSSIKGVTVEESYEYAELSNKLIEYAPDVGILLSIWPETFSYTLCELMAHSIPTVASAYGAATDRIQNGVNGFLVEPKPEQILALLQELSNNPEQLDRIRSQLLCEEVKTAHHMVLEYKSLFQYQSEDSLKSYAKKYLTGSPTPVSLNKPQHFEMTSEKDFFQNMFEFRLYLLNMVNKVPGINKFLRLVFSTCIRIWIFLPVTLASWFLKRNKQ